MNTDDTTANGTPNDGADDALSGLDGVIDELRADVPVSAEWRRSLAAALHEQRRPISVPMVGPRRVQLRPLVAAAAALGFVAVGALGATLLLGTNGATELATARPSDVESSASGIPTVGDSTRMGVRFSLVAPGARRVSVVGDFNGWDPSATPLELSSDGITWTTVMAMRTGRHSYAFVVDGEVTADPAAPAAPDDDFGIPNSLVRVSNIR